MIDSPAIDDLLDKTRRGLAWLRRNNNDFLDGKPSRHPDEEFGRLLDETASLEKTLRAMGYEGCILGEGMHCPDDAVITCDSCAGLPAPSEPESIGNQPPQPDGSQQLSMFQIAKGYP